MRDGRYLPANRVKAGSLRLGRLTVRASDGRELGKLAGFVIDSGAHRIRSFVVDAANQQLELPMGHVQFDPAARSLRLLDESDAAMTRPFSADLPMVEDDDLWVPFFHSAA
jgi:hypothetical protein